MYVDPTREQFEAFKALPRDKPVNMLNLVRFNEAATYPDGEIVSGKVAYERYGAESGAIFREVGGEIIWRGVPESLVIGPEDEAWDIMFIARYPTASAFMAMVTDERYRAIVHNRQLAVADSRLLRLGDADVTSGFG